MEYVSIKNIEITGGGTEPISPSDNFNLYKITGNATLSSNYEIEANGMVAVNGAKAIFFYEATVNVNGNHITILGKQIPDELAMVPFVVSSVWFDGAWQTNVSVDILDQTNILPGTALVDGSVDTTQLADEAVSLAKMDKNTADSIIVFNGMGIASILTPSTGDVLVKTSSGWVVSSYLEGQTLIGDGTDVTADNLHELIVVPVSFESSEQGAIKVLIPFKCDLVSFSPYVSVALAGVSAGLIEALDNSSASMGVATIPHSSAIGYGITVTPTVNNSFDAGDILTLQVSKANAGGKALVSIKLKRLGA